MSNEKVPLVAPTVGGLKEQHKKKEGKGYLAYGVIATALCMGFVANSQAGIFTAPPSPEVNLLRSSSTSGCEGWCESDRGTHTDSQLCGTGFLANLCGGCNFCQPKDDCQDWCEADRETHPDSKLCGSGDMANLCGGCEFCQPKDDCQDWCEADRGTHPDSQLCGSGDMANLCGGCNFCQSSPSGPTFTDIRGTHWADHSDPGGCAVPAFGGMEYRDDAIAVGDLRALGPLMIKTEPEGHRNCGQLYDIQCKNFAGVTGPKISAVVVSTCDVGDYSCGIDMITSTWNKVTKNANFGVASCTAELNKSSIFKNHEGMVCSFRSNDNCGDCQSNLYSTSVGLVNTKGKIVVSVSADGKLMRNNDNYNQFWDGGGGAGRFTGSSEFVFTFADGNTHTCLYNELQKPSNVHIW